MLDLILPSYDFSLMYLQKLVADVPDEKMCDQPVAAHPMNHAAWTIGHVAWVDDNITRYIGKQPRLENLKDLLGIGSKPQGQRSLYPSKDELVKMLNESHANLVAAVKAAPGQVFGELPPERMRSRFPSVGHMLVGLMTTHRGAHIGQLSAWRRVQGYPSV